MLVPRITYDTIAAIYGEAFAKLWFRAVPITLRIL
ncbi:hypothetical protein SAMN05444340_11191 [Citreimonas salinaria]|uniref:Uncharacterized protein n=1 Tax=Citreimonas salinaria TaxID=321339 RepID=A0A1H3L634_9RHOB|nr:hypothetical protein SAMN05444340_11191 [Citreimonas salinaria]